MRRRWTLRARASGNTRQRTLRAAGAGSGNFFQDQRCVGAHCASATHAERQRIAAGSVSRACGQRVARRNGDVAEGTTSASWSDTRCEGSGDAPLALGVGRYGSVFPGTTRCTYAGSRGARRRVRHHGRLIDRWCSLMERAALRGRLFAPFSGANTTVAQLPYRSGPVYKSPSAMR